MNKEVDALVIIGHSYKMSNDVPKYAREDAGQGLWYLSSGKTEWFNGNPITNQEKNGLYAGDVFLRLGQIAAKRYTQSDRDLPESLNSYEKAALTTFDEISPFGEGEALSLQTPTLDLAKMIRGVRSASPAAGSELKKKWAKANEVYAQRGSAAVEVYDVEDLLNGLGDLNIDEIAPDHVTFDDKLNVTSESHDVGNLIDRAGVKSYSTEIPYYQSFTSAEKDGERMLKSALEDLRSLGQALREQ